MSSSVRWAVGFGCGELRLQGKCHVGSLTRGRCSQAPAAAETQVWIWTLSPGEAVVTSPVRRSRTAPWRSGSDAAEADAHPATRGHQHARRPRRRRAGSGPLRRRRSVPDLAKVTVPPSPAVMTVGRNRSVCSRSAMPSAPQRCSRASSMPGGPAGPRLALGEVVDQVVERAPRRASRRCRCASPPTGFGPRAASIAQFATEDDVVGGRRGVHHHDVGRLERACCAASPSPG